MYSDELRNLVKYNIDLGKSYGEIAKIFNLFRYAVRSMVTYKKIPEAQDWPKNVIHAKEALQVKRYIMSQNTLGKKVWCNKIIQELQLDVS